MSFGLIFFPQIRCRGNLPYLEFLLLLFCPAENVFNLFSLTELGGMKYMDVRHKIHDVMFFPIYWFTSAVFSTSFCYDISPSCSWSGSCLWYLPVWKNLFSPKRWWSAERNRQSMYLSGYWLLYWSQIVENYFPWHRVTWEQCDCWKFQASTSYPESFMKMSYEILL